MNKEDLIEALSHQVLVGNNKELARRLAEYSDLEEVAKDSVVMEEDDPGNDLLMILKGTFSVLVGGSRLSSLQSGNHVGEMAVVAPGTTRSATVVAAEDSVVARLTDKHFEVVANEFPLLWKNLAIELASRLRQTNRWMSQWEPKAESPEIEED